MMVGMIPHLRGSSRNVAELSDIRGWWLTNWGDLRARLELCIVGADREPKKSSSISSDSESGYSVVIAIQSSIELVHCSKSSSSWAIVNIDNPSNHSMKSKAL